MSEARFYWLIVTIVFGFAVASVFVCVVQRLMQDMLRRRRRWRELLEEIDHDMDELLGNTPRRR